jgi:hypothetical protein
MDGTRLRAGAKLVVSTSEGDEEDEVTRVLVDGLDSGVSVVETARNGRVIIMRGREARLRWSTDASP